MIQLNFILRVAGREALEAGSDGEDPWEWVQRAHVVPAHDSWVWLHDKSAGCRPHTRARAGHPEHFRDYPSQSVFVPLYLDSLTEQDANLIGVEWHSWMNETLAPKPPDAAKAKQDEATRNEFAQHREMRAKRGADDE